MKTKTFFRSL